MAGMSGTGILFDNLSEYFDENNPKINLQCLDKFQQTLDLDIVEWHVTESNYSTINRNENVRTVFTKYLSKYNDLTKDQPRYKLLSNGKWIYMTGHS